MKTRKGGRENVREVMGEETDSEVYKSGRGYFTSVFYVKITMLLVSGTGCKIWSGQRMRDSRPRQMLVHWVFCPVESLPHVQCCKLENRDQRQFCIRPKEVGEDHIHRMEDRAECSASKNTDMWQERVPICFCSNHLICLHILQRREIRIFIFLPSLLNFLPSYFTFSHLFCIVLFPSAQNSTPTIANSSLLGDALVLDSCLPKDRGITSLKTSYFAVVKAQSLSLAQKPIIQLSLSVLSPYANLIESCLQRKWNCPLYRSIILWVHMCRWCLCVYARKQS